MIFLGDISVPNEKYVQLLDKTLNLNNKIFSGKSLICNLEGPISDKIHQSNEPILFNHPSVLASLNSIGEPIICLANNHIFDLPDEIESTIAYIKNNNLKFVGISNSENDTFEPLHFISGNTEVFLFNACWEFLIYNHKNPCEKSFLNIIHEDKLIQQVAKVRKLNKVGKIVLYFHWNFDLEVLPFPMHRQFSKDLIDAGADVVIGTHSHCVQGGEKYKDGHIFYGIGNFLIPHHFFANGKLVYPEFASIELVPEWDILNNEFKCHWFKYSYIHDESKLEYMSTEEMSGSQMLKYSPFIGMSSQEYINYFALNRRKRKGTPIFKDYKSHFYNYIFLYIIIFKARIARLLAKNNLIKWTN
ncbi:MAG: CapA family protein [Saprospiraceae bacterium]|nr:CapA family protein [Saprospiraceae bacterium]